MPTETERILLYLELIHPKAATIAEISQALMRPPQKVHQNLNDLMGLQVVRESRDADQEPIFSVFNHNNIETLERILPLPGRNRTQHNQPSYQPPPPIRPAAPPVTPQLPLDRDRTNPPTIPSVPDRRPLNAPSAQTRPDKPAPPLPPVHHQQPVVTNRSANQTPTRPEPPPPDLNPTTFLDTARLHFCQRYGKKLGYGQISTIPKSFNLVSADQTIVGHAEQFTLARDREFPQARFSTIAEIIWLLEKVNALHRFMVFGEEQDVPDIWIKKFGHLVRGVDLYFITGLGEIRKLT